jgi:hypothetical protein
VPGFFLLIEIRKIFGSLPPEKLGSLGVNVPSRRRAFDNCLPLKCLT